MATNPAHVAEAVRMMEAVPETAKQILTLAGLNACHFTEGFGITVRQHNGETVHFHWGIYVSQIEAHPCSHTKGGMVTFDSDSCPPMMRYPCGESYATMQSARIAGVLVLNAATNQVAGRRDGYTIIPETNPLDEWN